MKRRIKGYKLPPFVPLIWDLLNSKAYLELMPSAAKALPYFIGKPADDRKQKLIYGIPAYFGAVFQFSYREGKRLGFAFGTFSRVIRDLVRLGFLEPIDKGGLRGDGKSYNRFQICRRWERYGYSDFERKDWVCFIPKPR